MNFDESRRYIRQAKVTGFGQSGQARVAQSKVLVVGAGALGSPVLQYLVAAGVGSVGVLDADDVDISNLHRQVIYTTQDIGKPKAMVAAHRLRQMNPKADVVPYVVRLHALNAFEIIGRYDLVIDCTDNFPTKFLVNDACVILGKPFIIGGVMQFSGQLSVYNYRGGPTFRCLLQDEPDPLEVPSCSEAGVIGMVPGIIGTMQALEALKILAEVGTTLSGRLLNFNGLTMQFDEFEILLNPDNKAIKELAQYNYSCPDSILQGREISAGQFLEMLNEEPSPLVIALADDGDPIEVLHYHWETMPVYELPNKVSSLPSDTDIVLICEYGLKSLSVLRYLVAKHNFDRVYSLKDGVASLR